jgi:hypothetical protein
MPDARSGRNSAIEMTFKLPHHSNLVRSLQMAKTYSAPTVTSLGNAELVTRGHTIGTFQERQNFTTQKVLDL